VPSPRLEVDWRTCRLETQRIQSLVHSLAPLDPGHRKLVAEIAMIRLFLLIENTVASVAYKVLWGPAILMVATPSD